MGAAAKVRHGVIAALLLTILLLASPCAWAEKVELELVLAVDTSASVDKTEFALQLKGLSEAFRAPAVLDALSTAGPGGIAVTLLQWSRPDQQEVASPWVRVFDEASAAAFAGRLAAAPRLLDGGGTAIGEALEKALRELNLNAFEGRRKVIDVSGDGRANTGIAPASIRAIAVAQGVTINGLAIMNEDRNLDQYYEAEIIDGPGAFVLPAKDYRDFARAIVAKLVREISGPPIAGYGRAPRQRRSAALR